METVSIQKIRKGQVDQAVWKAIAEIGGISRYIPSGASVLIKPNLICARDWRTGTTTNPAVVEAIANLAWEAGAREVIIGEGSAVGHDTEKVFQALGYDKVAGRCGAHLMDLNMDSVPVDTPTGTVLQKIPISRTALEADVLINVPVLKTHSVTVVTLSLKNMKGLMDQARGKRRMHFVGLEEGIVDLNRAIAPDLVVVDGTVGQEGMGPSAGDPVQMDLILAGANRVAVDSVCCHVMGVDPETVRHIRLAWEAGLGPLALQSIRIKGERLDKVHRPFRLPAYEENPYDGVCIIQGTACSGCTEQIALALKEMQDSGELASIIQTIGHVNIIYGENANLPGNDVVGIRLYVGRCQRNSKEPGTRIGGCPVIGVNLQDTLRQLAGFQIQYPDWYEGSVG